MEPGSDIQEPSEEALTPERAAAFAAIALGHVTREYPHKPDHILTSDADVYRPRQVHPIFFGNLRHERALISFTGRSIKVTASGRPSLNSLAQISASSRRRGI